MAVCYVGAGCELCSAGGYEWADDALSECPCAAKDTTVNVCALVGSVCAGDAAGVVVCVSVGMAASACGEVYCGVYVSAVSSYE